MYSHSYPAPALPATEFYVLLCLARQPHTHAYILKHRIETDSLGGLKLADGTLYPLLKRLTKTELIAETSSDGVRRHYAITRAGEARLRQEFRRLSHALAIGQSLGYATKPDHFDPALTDMLTWLNPNA